MFHSDRSTVSINRRRRQYECDFWPWWASLKAKSPTSCGFAASASTPQAFPLQVHANVWRLMSCLLLKRRRFTWIQFPTLLQSSATLSRNFLKIHVLAKKKLNQAQKLQLKCEHKGRVFNPHGNASSTSSTPFSMSDSHVDIASEEEMQVDAWIRRFTQK